MRHVYLPALRDAERELASAGGDRVRMILRGLLGDDEQVDAFVERIGTELKKPIAGQEDICAHLEGPRGRPRPPATPAAGRGFRRPCSHGLLHRQGKGKRMGDIALCARRPRTGASQS
ncbi:hypothetical protein [Streptomyces sp. NPDC058653]|uniref:hypothetical protein n=1 Tax=Streptomyces sp. NPDC058653 TaxID=3346576 RepID=UPI00365598C5